MCVSRRNRARSIICKTVHPSIRCFVRRKNTPLLLRFLARLPTHSRVGTLELVWVSNDTAAKKSITLQLDHPHFCPTAFSSNFSSAACTLSQSKRTVFAPHFRYGIIRFFIISSIFRVEGRLRRCRSSSFVSMFVGSLLISLNAVGPLLFFPIFRIADGKNKNCKKALIRSDSD